MTQHSAPENKEKDVVLLILSSRKDRKNCSLGILQCGLQGGFSLKGKSLLQAIYLNKQDCMFAVGSLSKPNVPRAYVPAKKPQCLQQAVWPMASFVQGRVQGMTESFPERTATCLGDPESQSTNGGQKKPYQLSPLL